MASCEAQPSTAPVPAALIPETFGGGAGLPAGFPKFVDVPMAWIGDQFSSGDDFTLQLDGKDVTEAEEALAHFKGA